MPFLHRLFEQAITHWALGRISEAAGVSLCRATFLFRAANFSSSSSPNGMLPSFHWTSSLWRPNLLKSVAGCSINQVGLRFNCGKSLNAATSTRVGRQKSFSSQGHATKQSTHSTKVRPSDSANLPKAVYASHSSGSPDAALRPWGSQSPSMVLHSALRGSKASPAHQQATDSR